MALNTPIHRRNFVLHCIEGGIYMGGLAFVSAETVLPKLVQSLGGPDWVISLMPSLLLMFMFAPGIIASPMIERLPRLFPFVAAFGVIQRLPYLIAAIILYFGHDSLPHLVLWVVILTPIISGFSGGFAIPAWMEMVTRMVPEKRRASGWAIRFIIGSLLGILAGFLVEQILKTWPGAQGYGILHGAAFSLLMLSFATFVFLRETDFPDPVPHSKDWYGKQLRIFREIFTTRSTFRRMLLVRISGLGFLCVAPFLSITALELTQLPESVLGRFVTAQMLGGITGNLLAGWLGDRFGGKAILVAAKTLQLGLCALLILTTTYWGFMVAFFFFGMVFFMIQVGDQTLGIELAPRSRRAAFLASLNFSYIPGSLLASFLAWLMHRQFDSFSPTALCAGAMAGLSLLLLAAIKDPRSGSA
ncbi:MAG: MFS transporter [Verrucomicrobiota bacterium]